MYLWKLIATSRPRFWLYLGGTYLTGSALGFQDFYAAANPIFWAYFLFFLIPANVFLYGINDYFDQDTDRFNKKKGTKEVKLKNEDKLELKIWLWVSVIMGTIFFLIQTNIYVKLSLAVFFILAYTYSAPPIRFKAKPFWDFISNLMYLTPGIIGYTLASGQLPDWFALWGFACWTFAMHIFSAIPDIEADKKAGIVTTAVKLGVVKSILLCGVFWSIFSLVMMTYINWYPWNLGSLIYPGLMFYILFQPRSEIVRLYWFFPILSGFLGFVVYWIATLRLL